MIEIEQRYKITDRTAALAQLAKQNVVPTTTQHIIDKWFVPTHVHNRADHDKWFDTDHGIAYRIRQLRSNGTTKLVLDSKQHTAANNHNTFKEEVIMNGDETAMLQFTQTKGYYNWLTIDKQRQNFASPLPHLQIVMDTVSGVKPTLGLDTVLEIEYDGPLNREQALATINNFASQLGLKSTDLFDKSLTVESMRVLARFQ